MLESGTVGIGGTGSRGLARQTLANMGFRFQLCG